MLDCQDAVNFLASQTSNSTKCFVLLQKKWAVLKEIVFVLAIPYRATIAMQSKDLTLSDLFGVWLKMELSLRHYSNKTSLQTNLSKRLLDAMCSRKENIFSNPFMASAIYLDPRFRSQIIFNEEKVNEAKNTLINLWRRMHVIGSKSNNTSNVSAESLEFDEQIELDKYLVENRDANITESIENNNENDNIEMLIDLFAPGTLSSSESVIDYWESIKQDNAQLYKLAMVVFAIPPTEVQIERDFSKLDYVFNDRRCKLAHERLEDIMIINLNPDLFYVVKHEEIAELNQQINS